MSSAVDEWLRDMLAGALGGVLVLCGGIILINRYVFRFVRLSDTGGASTTISGFVLVVIGVAGLLWFASRYRAGHV